MKFLRHKRSMMVGTAFLLGCQAFSVQAQDAAEAVTAEQAAAQAAPVNDGDIVVTARRRSETLQSVPVSVTAITSAALEQRGYQSVTDIQQSTPNLAFTPGSGGTSSQISGYIRGVGEYDYIITSDPAVAVFIDGVYQARPFGAITSLLGIDRVEVLRGPQGSLFGKNTIGGAISIVTHQPEGSNTGTVDFKTGSYGLVQFRGLYDGSLSDDLSYSTSLLAKRSQGWQRNTAGGDLGNDKQVAGRLALRWKPEGLDATLSVDGLHQRQNSAAHAMIEFQPTFFSNLYSTYVTPCCTVSADPKRTTASTPSLNIDNADAVNTNLTLAFGGGDWGFKSISGIRYSDVTFARDGDASVVNFTGDRQHITATQLSQELQISNDSLFGGRGRLLMGLFGFYEDAHQQINLVTADGLYPALIAAGFDPAMASALDFNVDFDLRHKTSNVAVFGNFTYDLTDKLSVDVGGRLTYEHKDLVESAIRKYSRDPLIAGVPEFQLSKSWSNFSPKVTASYKFSPLAMAYLTFSQGFRSGGFNGRPTSAQEIGAYNPEKLTSIEFGNKLQFFDRRVRLNSSVFYNRYTDQQVLTSFLGTGGLIVVRTENAGQSRMWGFESEAQFQASDALSFDASVGYINARYLKYLSSDAAGTVIDLSNLKLKHTPTWSGSIGSTLKFPVSSTADATLRVDASYQDRQFIDVINTPELEAKQNVIVNASINIDLSESFQIGVEGQNLTNVRVIKEGFDGRSSFGFLEAYYNPPRRIHATARYRF